MLNILINQMWGGFNLGRKKAFIQSHWRRNAVLQKTFRRKLCILTVLLRAIIAFFAFIQQIYIQIGKTLDLSHLTLKCLKKSTRENVSCRSRKR